MSSKRILITGANSYIGKKFKEYVLEYDGYEVYTIDLLDYNWKLHDFSFYDVVLHVAAIVHKKEKKKDEASYYKVNTELAYEVANKAKKEGIKQFIVMSSIAVDGCKAKNGKDIEITKDTLCKPVT